MSRGKDREELVVELVAGEEEAKVGSCMLTGGVHLERPVGRIYPILAFVEVG